VLTTITSHVRGFPPCHGINVSPSGRLPSSLARPTAGLLGYRDACCCYGTGNDVIDGLMPGYSTRGLLTHRAVNPLCIDGRPTSTGMGQCSRKRVQQLKKRKKVMFFEIGKNVKNVKNVGLPPTYSFTGRSITQPLILN